MTDVLLAVASMSIAGTVLYAAAALLRRIFRDRMSCQAQFLLLLPVLVRFLLPFGPTDGFLGRFSAADPAAISAAAGQTALGTPQVSFPPAAAAASGSGAGWDALPGFIWLAGAASMYVWTMVQYGLYVRSIQKSSEPADATLLEKLTPWLRPADRRRQVRLRVSRAVPSPILIGVIRPVIVLPEAARGQDLRHGLLHELMHLRRADIAVRLLMHTAVCVHWFNPAVYLLRRQLEAAGELACDEAVLRRLGSHNALAYGETLLAAARAGLTRPVAGSAGLAKQKTVLRERLLAVASYASGRRRVLWPGVIAAAAAAVLAWFLGVFPSPGTGSPLPEMLKPVPSAAAERADEHDAYAAPAAETEHRDGAAATKLDGWSVDTEAAAEHAYRTGNLPGFQSCFASLAPQQQEEWLHRLYAERAVPFYGAAVGEAALGPEAAGWLAEKSYADGDAAFFSMTMDMLGRDTLEMWYRRAEADRSLTFLSVLADELGHKEEVNLIERELAEQQRREYEAAGITMDEAGYLYRGRRVRILYDPRPDGSCFLLHFDPDGDVSVQVERSGGSDIAGVRVMSEQEESAMLADFAPEPASP